MKDITRQQALFEYTLRLGDNSLILGQRLSEWCGHGPFLEEDIAMSNIALDLLGRSRMLLTYAGQTEGKNRTEDSLAYFRDEREWQNFLIMELPKGDFAFTMVRQFLVDTYNYYLYEALQQSTDETLASIAGKAIKEAKASGATDFDLGRSDWTNPGLITFKDHWNATRSTLTYYRHPQLLPEGSAKDWKTEFAKRVVPHLPDRLLTLTGSAMYRHYG